MKLVASEAYSALNEICSSLADGYFQCPVIMLAARWNRNLKWTMLTTLDISDLQDLVAAFITLSECYYGFLASK